MSNKTTILNRGSLCSRDAALRLNWTQIDLEQFRRGLEVELEHGEIDPEINVTGDNLVLTGKIAWAPLKELRDYYTRLDQLEAEAEEQFKMSVEH